MPSAVAVSVSDGTWQVPLLVIRSHHDSFLPSISNYQLCLLASPDAWVKEDTPVVTYANQITLARILLIPVFVGFALYYAHSVQDGVPDERLYWAAVITFAVASLSDALDGYIARRFKQQSKLGVILDPLADKLLMLAAVCTLSFSAWPAKLPLYFVILSLSREVFTIVGAFVIKYCAGKVHIEPHWTGKLSTFTQIAAISAAMLRWDTILPWTVAIASVFVVTSGGVYIYEAYRQISAAGHRDADA